MQFREEIRYYKQWWKAPGHERHVKMLNDVLASGNETRARKLALGIAPEQLVTVGWMNFWKGLNK